MDRGRTVVLRRVLLQQRLIGNVGHRGNTRLPFPPVVLCGRYLISWALFFEGRERISDDRSVAIVDRT